MYPSWAIEISPYQAPGAVPEGSKYHSLNILECNLFQITNQSFQGIIIDAPICPADAPMLPGMISIAQFATLSITDELIPFGFIFIWTEKELIPDILQVAESWKFHYVENICWVRHEINNKISYQDARFFRKSKLTLMVFRKDGDIELRHQRNADVVMDFLKADTETNSNLVIPEEKPSLIYKTIETLLPNANYMKTSNGDIQTGKLLEITWRPDPIIRPGWTIISHQPSSS